MYYAYIQYIKYKIEAQALIASKGQLTLVH